MENLSVSIDKGDSNLTKFTEVGNFWCCVVIWVKRSELLQAEEKSTTLRLNRCPGV
jgi:hypothetical protein